MNPTRKQATADKTSKTKPASKAEPSKERIPTPKEAAKMLHEVSSEVDSIIEDFHLPQTAHASDLTMIWDVRLMHSKGKLFTQSRGISSMPGIFSRLMLSRAPEMMSNEIEQKIVTPLTSEVQEEVQRIALDNSSQGGKGAKPDIQTEADELSDF